MHPTTPSSRPSSGNSTSFPKGSPSTAIPVQSRGSGHRLHFMPVTERIEMNDDDMYILPDGGIRNRHPETASGRPGRNLLQGCLDDRQRYRRYDYMEQIRRLLVSGIPRQRSRRCSARRIRHRYRNQNGRVRKLLRLRVRPAGRYRQQAHWNIFRLYRPQRKREAASRLIHGLRPQVPVENKEKAATIGLRPSHTPYGTSVPCRPVRLRPKVNT